MAQHSGPSEPKYRRIADDLRARIESGEYPVDSQLPTKAVLMDQYGVALNTVERAIAELRAAGIVETMQGSGMFVREPPAAEPGHADVMRRLGELEERVGALEGRMGEVEAERRPPR